MLYTVKIFFKKEGKIKKLSGKQNSRESGTNRAELQGSSQEVDPTKENENENNSCLVCIN